MKVMLKPILTLLMLVFGAISSTRCAALSSAPDGTILVSKGPLPGITVHCPDAKAPVVSPQVITPQQPTAQTSTSARGGELE